MHCLSLILHCYSHTGLTRDYLEGQDVFMKNDGLSVLLRAMQSDIEKLKIKAAFMLCSLLQSRPAVKGILLNNIENNSVHYIFTLHLSEK